MTKNIIDSGDKKAGSTEFWSKIKYDRQIAAIARVRQASAIYTDDNGLAQTAERLGIHVVRLVDLPLPAEKAQGELPLEQAAETPEEPTLEEIEDARDAEPDSSPSE